jgi:hypothetical protein
MSYPRNAASLLLVAGEVLPPSGAAARKDYERLYRLLRENSIKEDWLEAEKEVLEAKAA